MFAMRYLPRFRRAYRALEMLAERESWSRERIQEFQLERLNQLWSHSISHVPYYRTLRREQNLPEEFASLAEFQDRMPELPKQEVTSKPIAFLSERADKGKWRLTSGSTGLPAKFFSGREAHLEMLRAKYRVLAMFGMDIFAPTVYLWGRPSLFQLGWRRTMADWNLHMQDFLRNRRRLCAFNLHPERLKDYLRQIQSFQPERIYAYSIAMYLLACQAETESVKCENLKLIVISSEPASARMVRAIERVWGVPAVIEYGATECGVIASEWPDRTLRVRDDIVLVETVPQSDSRYRLLITVLNNPSFPLIRYCIGDVTSAPLRYPERGFAILQDIIGRDNDVLVGRSGRYLHATRAEGILDVEYVNQVQQYFIHQRLDGGLRVQIQLKHSGVQMDRARLSHQLSELVDGYPVQVDVVDRICTARGGKLQWVVSDLAKRRIER